MWPSLPDALYLLTFFGGTLWIALGHSLTGSRVYRLGRLALVTLAALQLLALYFYQLQLSQSWIAPSETLPLLIGLVAFVRVDCAEPWALRTQPFEKPADWARLAYPLLIGALYALLIPQLRKEEFLREQVCSCAHSRVLLLELTVFLCQSSNAVGTDQTGQIDFFRLISC